MPDEAKRGLKSPFRRKLLTGMVALPAISMLPRTSWADIPPTSAVNTTGLAVTDSEATIGILHSITGTMAISETGSVEAEKLAIEQINADADHDRWFTAQEALEYGFIDHVVTSAGSVTGSGGTN